MTNIIDIPELRPGRRRRFSREEKVEILTEAARQNETLSSLGRRYGIAVSLLFRWKKELGFDVAAPPSPEAPRDQNASIEDVLRAMRALEAEVNWLSRQNRRLQERVTQFESGSTAFRPANLPGRQSI